jgi:protein-S-isoprenylcysteine O-methyltransferase Ste14
MNPKIPPPLIAVLIGAAMWGTDRALPLARVEFALRLPVATLLLAAGVLLAAAAIAAFVRAGTTINPLRPARASTLITHGVFRFSRNPIYLADLIILTAGAVWLGNILNILFLLIFLCAIQRFQILPEEQALGRLFGDHYTAYCTQVRRWL